MKMLWTRDGVAIWLSDDKWDEVQAMLNRDPVTKEQLAKLLAEPSVLDNISEG